MSPDPHTANQAPAAPAGVAEAIDRLSRFDGPPEQFLGNLLAVQCEIGSADSGAILRLGQAGPEVLAMVPRPTPNAPAPMWLAQAAELAEAVSAQGQTRVVALHNQHDLYGAPADRHLLVLPLRGSAGVRGVAAFVVTVDADQLDHSRERLELTVSLLSLYEMRLTLQRRQADLRRVRGAMEILSAVNAQERFTGAAMAAVNEIASRFGADRVSVGFAQGRSVRVRAVSHTEKFSRKMEVIQAIEQTMEECLDQDLEVVHPNSPEDTFVARSAETLARKYGPSTVLSLPLRQAGEPVGVLTLERPADQPFQTEEIESLRLTCEMVTPRLASLRNSDRWFGAKAAAGARSGLAAVVGPRHTWLKVATVLVFAAVAALVLFKGTYRVEAPVVIRADQRRVVQAPIEGDLADIHVEAGDTVQAGDILAELKHDLLDNKLSAARAQYAKAMIDYDNHLSAGKTAEAKMALASARAAQAEMDVLDAQIEQSRIRAPIAGTVLFAMEKPRRNDSVERGQEMFVVAQAGRYRAELSVPEDQIADVTQDKAGQLVIAGKPGVFIPFEVERIHPIAETEDDKNVFKVRATLPADAAQKYPWLKAGLEGEARVDIDRRSLGWIYSRRLVNWVRMKLWW